MCPKTKEQFAAIRTRSEEKILDAALQLFATKGFKSTSISNIAATAGISKGLMYNYFDSKTDLLRRIVSRAVETGTDIIEDALDRSDLPKEELTHIVLNSVKHVKEYRAYWKLLSSIAHQPEVMAEIQDLVQQNTNWSLQKGIELFSAMGSLDPRTSSMLFSSSLDGMFLHYMHLGNQYPIDLIADTLIETFTSSSIHSNLKK